MTDLRINGIKATGSAIVLAAAMNMAASGAASAADWSTTFLSTNKVEYIDNFVNDEQNVAIREDDVRLSTNNNLFVQGILEGGEIVRIGGRMQYFQHIDRTDQDNMGLGVYADIGKRLEGGFFVRGGYFGNYRRKDGVNQYLENGGSFTLRYATTRDYALIMNLRGAYRDFDDNNFPGLDQSRFAVTGRAFWYPYQDRTFLMGEVGALNTGADNAVQSNLLWFVGVRAKYQFNDTTSVTLRAKYSAKNFDAGGREDDIYSLFGQVDHKFNDNITGFAEAGVVDQQSNLAVQDFTGPRFGVGVKLLFSTR